MSLLLIDLRQAIGRGLELSRIELMFNQQTNALFFTDLEVPAENLIGIEGEGDRKSTRLNSSHSQISYAVFCLKKKKLDMRDSIPRFVTTRGILSCFSRTADARTGVRWLLYFSARSSFHS